MITPVRTLSVLLLALLTACGESAAEPAEPEPLGPPVVWGQDGNTWLFKPAKDPFSELAEIDLREMNETEAGEYGFIQLSEDGNSFVRGDGEPIRFWATGTHSLELSPEDMQHQMRFLAKRGVNMIRIHTNVMGEGEKATLDRLDPQRLDAIHRLVAAAKANGIYVTISPFFPLMKLSDHWQLEGVPHNPGSGRNLLGLIYTSPELQEAYKFWTRQLYTTPNRYCDGVPLKDEPAVAILQVLNEDSMFFWTFDNLPEPQRQRLESGFYRWLIQKYGSVENLYKTWGDEKDERDAVEAEGEPGGPRIGLKELWVMTQPPPDNAGAATRIRDQTEFLARYQKAFYAMMIRHLREELGCRQLINATNWRTAHQNRLGDLERWTYTAGDVMAANRYFNALHLGENSGWRLEPHHLIASASTLTRPLAMPFHLKQVEGSPMIMTEQSWTMPNRYRAEGPLLMAAYTSLSGVDASYFFVSEAAGWNHDPKFPWQQVDGQNPRVTRDIHLPSTLGMFPANAVMFRNGYVEEGEPVIQERRTLESMFDRQLPVVGEAESYDPIRDTADRRDNDQSVATDDPQLAYLVGPVTTRYDAEDEHDEQRSLAPFVDPEAGTIRSVTQQLTLDYRHGLFTLDTPKAQAAAGFFSKLSHAGNDGEGVVLADATIRCDNEYAVIELVSLDGEPIATSTRLLLQVGTPSNRTGWTTQPTRFEHEGRMIDGEKIINLGEAFYTRSKISSLPCRNPQPEPDPGDAAGRQLRAGAGAGAGSVRGDAFSLRLPGEAMYVLLH